MNGEITQVALGWTDGCRYVGIMPPLDETEVDVLNDHELVRDEWLEHVGVEPECTLVRFGCSDNPEVATKRAQETAMAIADVLRDARKGRVNVILEPVSLVGYESSPFNPSTDTIR